MPRRLSAWAQSLKPLQLPSARPLRPNETPIQWMLRTAAERAHQKLNIDLTD